jgi:hypothetical protein
MSYRYHAPLDPECPEVIRWNEAGDDPISQSCGCWDEFTDAFEKRHRHECERCQEYGAANIEVV